jgi:hypothetical protein
MWTWQTATPLRNPHSSLRFVCRILIINPLRHVGGLKGQIVKK